MTESVVRLLPGVLGHEDSSQRGFVLVRGSSRGRTYTRPREFRGHAVPEVLLSGDHAVIRAWRREESLRRTRERQKRDLLQSEKTDGA